jgi:hypothetical protein
MLRNMRLLQFVVTGSVVFCMHSALAADTVVRQFSAGATSTTVGIAAASEDVELLGPQALTSDAEGNLFVLDQINGRILRFNPKQPAGNDPSILKMPADVQPNDLIVRKSDILVWDGSIRTLKASNEQSTRGIDGGDVVQLEEVVTRGPDDPIAVSAFAQMGSQAPGSAAELLDQNTRAAVIKQKRPTDRQYIASRGKGSVIADVIPANKGESSARIEIQTMDSQETIAQLSLRVPHKLGTVEFLEIDNNDRFYVLGEDVPDRGQRSSTFVARYAPSGALEGVYELPLENTPITRRFVTVSGTGDVYFLRTTLLGVDVVAVGFRPLKNASVIDRRLPGKPRTIIETIFDTVAAAVRPANRQQTIETAFAFEGLQWKLTPANYGGDPDTACTGFSRIRRPWYLQGKVNQEVRGVPYCWGCHGSLANFRQRIEAGTKAGNICTHDAPRFDVAGVDCSAFVSAAWGLSVHYTTAAIPAIAKPVENPWDLKPGDALNKPGSHVMLFLRFTPDRKAEVMEASTGGCNGRVCRNVYPLASLLQRGFVPVRFRALAADETSVPVGAYQEPEPPSGRAKKSRAAKRQAGERG